MGVTSQKYYFPVLIVKKVIQWIGPRLYTVPLFINAVLNSTSWGEAADPPGCRGEIKLSPLSTPPTTTPKFLLIYV